MTYLHFTLQTKEIQSLIEKSVEDDVSKNLLMTIINQWFEKQNLQANEIFETSVKTARAEDYLYPLDTEINAASTVSENIS